MPVIGDIAIECLLPEIRLCAAANDELSPAIFEDAGSFIHVMRENKLSREACAFPA